MNFGHNILVDKKDSKDICIYKFFDPRSEGYGIAKYCYRKEYNYINLYSIFSYFNMFQLISTRIDKKQNSNVDSTHKIWFENINTDKYLSRVFDFEGIPDLSCNQ